MSEEKRQAERKPISTEVEFYIDADIIEASSVDISESGIRFTSPNPIRIRMRFQADGKQYERLAELVWSRRSPAGDMDYGLEYIEDTDKILLD